MKPVINSCCNKTLICCNSPPKSKCPRSNFVYTKHTLKIFLKLLEKYLIYCCLFCLWQMAAQGKARRSNYSCVLALRGALYDARQIQELDVGSFVLKTGGQQLWQCAVGTQPWAVHSSYSCLCILDQEASRQERFCILDQEAFKNKLLPIPS